MPETLRQQKAAKSLSPACLASSPLPSFPPPITYPPLHTSPPIPAYPPPDLEKNKLHELRGVQF